jgi:hypothetical protein
MISLQFGVVPKKALYKLHPTIKFTSEFDYEENSTTFLDTKITIIDGKLTSDLFKKPTHRAQYLLSSSCHPSHICDNIPYSLALRLVKICSTKTALDKRLAELKDMLLSCGYRRRSIAHSIQKAKRMTRSQALERVEKKPMERVVFALTLSPHLPSVSHIINKHWRYMTMNPLMKKIFPQPPMVSFRQPPNLKRTLCRAKVPEQIGRINRI